MTQIAKPSVNGWQFLIDFDRPNINKLRFIYGSDIDLPHGLPLPSFFVILLVMNLLRGILKGKYAQAVLQGLKPCMIGIILATGVYMTLHNCFPLVQGAKADLRALLIVVVLAACMAMYRTLKKKKLSPILLIIASAMLGILIY
ncbi:chromate transporter [Oscillibacter sp. ER4]|uniref:chromate transporter n=1 Tax=Oscillibacter sp. ER4 TaxID=1519439 RepID=UPI00068AD801|nr:chromate transporter [Oscillibacter sp. ER4]